MANNNIEILVVDDVPENLKLISSFLRPEGYQVRLTTDPLLAIEFAISKPPHLILLDIKMPGIDGYEVCRRLKNDERSRNIPIIFISALDEAKDRVKSFQAGGVDFITKPIQKEEVLARVQSQLTLHLTAQHLEQMVRERTQALSSSEARYRTLYESSLDAVLILAPDSLGYVAANPAAVEMFRASDEDALIATSFTDILPEQQADGLASIEKFHGNIQQALTSGACHFDWLFKRLEGRVFPASVSLTIIQLEEETLLQATIHDLTAEREAEQLFSRVVQSAIDGFYITNERGAILEVNDALCKLLGYTFDELTAMHVKDLEEAEQHRVLTTHFNIDIQQGYDRFETRYKHKDGNQIDVQVSARSLDHKHLSYVFVQDIRDRLQAERQMRQSAVVFDNTADAIAIADASKKIISINKAFTRMFHYSLEEAKQRDICSWKPDQYDDQFYQRIWRSLSESGIWRDEILNQRRDGEVFHAIETISLVLDDKGQITHYIALVSDLSAIKGFEKRLQFLKHYDPLTGLPNRAHFGNRLKTAVQRARELQKPLALLSVGLDDFKPINDALGRASGDQVLWEVAGRLSDLTDERDAVAHISGDEYMILLENIDNENDVAAFAEKISEHLVEPLKMPDGITLHQTASIGISLFPNDGLSAEELLKHADTAMHQAKAEGKNRYSFYITDLTQAASEILRLENQLREAIENNQLTLFYQPQYSLETGKLVGAEALIRWLHPQEGMLMPGVFIPIAERTSLIESIGLWVMNNASNQMRMWLNDGVDLEHLSINVSSRQIENDAFVSLVKQALDSNQLTSSQLELEITESMIMDQQFKTLNKLDQIRQLGISLAIDDFGTGYSSLSYLKKLPVQRLKIDRSFVTDINEEDSLSIVRAIIALGKSLGLKIIAEGVETEEQATLLKNEGCNEVQGYLYSRPVSADDFYQLVKGLGARGDDKNLGD
jgi:diguanylate cyclase (GGDEF)-like protein/PAS domain S-box-containing protein